MKRIVRNSFVLLLSFVLVASLGCAKKEEAPATQTEEPGDEIVSGDDTLEIGYVQQDTLAPTQSPVSSPK